MCTVYMYYCYERAPVFSKVFQRRINGDLNFYMGWDAYVNGFGEPFGEYWLGKALHLFLSFFIC